MNNVYDLALRIENEALRKRVEQLEAEVRHLRNAEALQAALRSYQAGRQNTRPARPF